MVFLNIALMRETTKRHIYFLE